MRAVIAALAALLVLMHAVPARAADASRPAVLPLRDEEDWRVMRDPAHRTDPLDALKYVRIGSRDDQFVTLSADVRYWYEKYVDQDWNPANGSNAYVLPRFLLGADVHDGRAHAFVQLESATAAGRAGGPGPIFRDDFDPTDAYVAWRFGPRDAARSSSALIAGRQELDYGAGRVLSARDGAGVRQSFDGVRAVLRSAAWRADVFTMHPVTVGLHAFDDAVDTTQTLTGIYASRTLTGGKVFEAYLLDSVRGKAVLGRGVAAENRWTAGLRAVRPAGRLTVEAEAAYQFGTFASRPVNAKIAAVSVAGSVAYRFGGNAIQPTLTLGAGYGSGDTNPRSSTLRTFVPPSFRGSYLGAVQENGPANSIAFEPSLALTYRARTQLTLADVIVRQATSADAIYGLAGFPLRKAAPGASNSLGGGPLVSLSHAFDRHLTAGAVYQRFNAGRHFFDAPPNASISYERLTLEYRI